MFGPVLLGVTEIELVGVCVLVGVVVGVFVGVVVDRVQVVLMAHGPGASVAGTWGALRLPGEHLQRARIYEVVPLRDGVSS